MSKVLLFSKQLNVVAEDLFQPLRDLSHFIVFNGALKILTFLKEVSSGNEANKGADRSVSPARFRAQGPFVEQEMINAFKAKAM